MRLFSSWLYAFVLALIKHMAWGFNYDYTILLGAGERECYYQPITVRSGRVEIEYQVLDMSPINFQVKGPRGMMLMSDVRKPANVMELKIEEAGLYELCIINRYSNTPKSVYLGLYADIHDKHWPFNHIEEQEEKTEEATTYMDVAVTELRKYMETVTSSVEKMRYLQQSIRTYNVKDYIVQRGNFSRVNTFSAIQLAVMVLTSVMQVVTIRKLFGTNTTQARANMKMST